MRDQKHNMNPHREARMAMWMWSKRYSEYSGGSIDFWNSLSDNEKRICREVVAEIMKCDHGENDT